MVGMFEVSICLGYIEMAWKGRHRARVRLVFVYQQDLVDWDQRSLSLSSLAMQRVV